jgi:hypothetical protein
MQLIVIELPRCRAFEVSDDSFDVARIAPDDHVHMLRQNRAGVNDVPAVGDRLRETLPDCERLAAGENNRREIQRVFGRFAGGAVVGFVGD